MGFVRRLYEELFPSDLRVGVRGLEGERLRIVS